MELYYGTDRQIALQKKVDALASWIRTTPGACLVGRIRGTDDPDRLGWDTIFASLEDDGVFGFRLLASSDLHAVEARLSERGYRFDSWDVFAAPAQQIRDALDRVDMTLPDNYRAIRADAANDTVTVRNAQRLMSENEVTPFSGDVLTGKHAPAALVAIEAPDGTLAAAAFCYFPHNEHSPHHKTAWGGLVAVGPEHRGRRLGAIVNAMMLRAAIDRLGAAGVYELVTATNEPSRRMVQRCGLVHDPDLVCGMAIKGGERFTK
jgi:GNAT superfamily N-acetyltransferase